MTPLPIVPSMILPPPAQAISPHLGISPAKEVLTFILSLLLGFGLFGAIYTLLSPLLSHSIFGIAITQNIVVFFGASIALCLLRIPQKGSQSFGINSSTTYYTRQKQMVRRRNYTGNNTPCLGNISAVAICRGRSYRSTTQRGRGMDNPIRRKK